MSKYKKWFYNFLFVLIVVCILILGRLFMSKLEKLNNEMHGNIATEREQAYKSEKGFGWLSDI